MQMQNYTMSKLLIIAPDPGFRESLRFALEAEGHAVTTREGLNDPDGNPEDVDCSILDHHAAQGHLPAAIAFAEAMSPVILLANTGTHPLAAHCFSTVTKPFLGPYLSKAIASALRHRQATA